MRIHIIHVPGADPLRDEIVDRLGREAEACLHLDPERKGLMQNWLKAMDCAAHSDGPQPWSYVLSDDADPFDNWTEHLHFASFYSPAPILGLTYMGGWGVDLTKKAVPYGLGDNLIWGNAIGYHGSLMKPLSEWCHRVVEETGYIHDDYLVASYAYGHGLQTAMTTRAIFDRAEVRSMIGHHLHEGKPSNRPSHTIVNGPGPWYGSEPRYAMVKRPLNDQQRELAKL